MVETVEKRRTKTAVSLVEIGFGLGEFFRIFGEPTLDEPPKSLVPFAFQVALELAAFPFVLEVHGRRARMRSSPDFPLEVRPGAFLREVRADRYADGWKPAAADFIVFDQARPALASPRKQR